MARRARKRAQGKPTSDGAAGGPELPRIGPIHQPFRELERLRSVIAEHDEAREQAALRRRKAEEAARSEKKAAEQRARESDPATWFAEAVAGAKPLDADRAGRVSRGARPVAARPARLPESVQARLEELLGDGWIDPVAAREHIEGIAAGADRALLGRLRRGEFAVQAHIDLHGLTRDQAHERVGLFFDEARARGLRCVLVVHGRGLGSPGGIPVLKEELRGWLSRGRLGRGVLAFSTAQRHDGGAGATYVLLRR